MNNHVKTQIIIDYLKNNNMSKTAFCKKCNLSVKTYEKIINGEDFKVVALFKIARLINCQIHNLVKQSWQF